MRTSGRRRPPAPFSLLLGGLAASFVAATVFCTFMTPSTEAANEHAPLWATLAGLACALLFVVAGAQLARAWSVARQRPVLRSGLHRAVDVAAVVRGRARDGSARSGSAS